MHPYAAYSLRHGGRGSVLQLAAVMNIALFIGLSAVAFFFKRHFSFLRSILVIGFVIVLGLIVSGTIFGFDLGLWFSGAIAALAAGSILYSTSNMVHRYQGEQYDAAALGLFASIMWMFFYILHIFLSRD